MAKTSGQKLKLLYLARILMNETDEEHGMTVQQMIDALEAKGVNAERKSIYDDLDSLRMFGMDIERSKTKTWNYYVANRNFQLAELKWLVDAVQSSRFITRKKSDELIGKLESLASRHQAGSLQRQVYVAGRIKSMNESIYYAIDALHEAISANKQITFRYFEWTVDKKKKYRHDGQRYRVSPYTLVWNDEYYYLVAYDHGSDMIRNYRVDRMQNVQTEPEKRQGQDRFAQIDPTFYTKRVFDMYNGTEERVTMRFDTDLASAVIDRFGSDVHLADNGDGSFDVSVQLVPSPRFYGWLFGFGKKAALTAPASAVENYQKFVDETVAHYREVSNGHQ